jgi:tetratricopeptide (TPR) repeat protein
MLARRWGEAKVELAFCGRGLVAELELLKEAEGPPTKHVIFVHGLGGDLRKTWTSPPPPENNLWPLWLAGEIPGLMVWTLGYDAPASEWTGAAMELADRAGNVLSLLLEEKRLHEGELIFVGHSLGGLVIKQALRKAYDRAPDESETKSLLDRARKVAFLATPHLGADLADTGEWYRWFVKPSAATRSLLTNDSHLRDLNQWYRRWARRHRVDHLVLFETKETSFLGMVVKPDSSDPGLSSDPIAIDADHVAIAKPRDRNSQVYKLIRQFIARASAPPPRIEEPETGPPPPAEPETVDREAIVALAKRAEEAGLERETIIALAKKIRPDDSIDFDLAVKELASAVEIALDAIALGQRGTNLDAFVNQVLQQLGELTKSGQFDKGSKVVDDALAELETEKREEDERFRRSQIALLEAGVEQDKLRRDAPAVARRLEKIALTGEPGARAAWTKAFRAFYDQYEEEGDRKGVNFSLEIAIELARISLASAQSPDERGEAGNLLGLPLWELGERESGPATLREAVAAYRAALQEYTRERVPLQWAMTQNNLGLALFGLGERESETATLQEAVAAYRAALQEYTRERVPLQWAAAQINLGNALARLGEREIEPATLREAVAAYRAALQEYTRERVPLDWAMTQNSLGAALSRLGERESGTATLREAVSAYGAALQEYTRERVPLQWASSLGNQGVAMSLLADRTMDASKAETAVRQIEAALETFRAGGHAPFAAVHAAQLPKTRAVLDRLKAG